MKVATVFLAALVPLALYITVAGPVADQLYLRFAQPRCRPRALSEVVVPATGLGVADAALTIVVALSTTTCENFADVSCGLELVVAANPTSYVRHGDNGNRGSQLRPNGTVGTVARTEVITIADNLYVL